MITLFFAALVSTLSISPESNGPNPPELGRVHFGRDVEAALRTAGASKRPVFLLFQEIPGCATCKGFGAGPLSDLLLVEAIETLFVPVAIHNNEGGADAAALKRFSEAAWNNPVVRFLDANAHDLVAPKEGIWSSAGIAARMVAALEKARLPVPEWLALARAELDTTETEHVVLAMRCFWEGQAALGGIQGVVDARPGFHDGWEVVDVAFSPRILSCAELVQRADKLECALRVLVADPKRVSEARAIVGDRAKRLDGSVQAAQADDDLRRLRSARNYDLAPMTRAQAVHVNALLAAGADPRGVLSPRQLESVKGIERVLVKQSSAFDGVARPAEASKLARYADEVAQIISRRASD